MLKKYSGRGEHTYFMSTHTQQVVQKLWNYCNILRDDGMSYGDYVEQLTYLLFLKMAYERTLLHPEQEPRIPQKLSWMSLIKLQGVDLEEHYRIILAELGQ